MKAGETMNDKNEGVEKILISVEEACEITNIGRNRMLKLSKTKGFPAIIFKRKILIDRGELPNWVRRNYGQWSD